MTTRAHGGHSMVAPLRSVLVCPPGAAGWSRSSAERWQRLGYSRRPDPAAAGRQHAALCAALREAGVEVLQLDVGGGLTPDADEGLTPDAVYAHDASLITDGGAILLRMGKEARGAEPARHREFYAAAGVPVLGAIEPPGSVEAGDVVWLDGRTLLVGRGHRTDDDGVAQLARLVAPLQVEVVRAPLPYGGGPDACLHLMSVLSLLDERTALVDAAWLAVETVELLHRRGFRLVEIDDAERGSLACNVLALGEGHLLAFAENRATNRRLRDAGFEVEEVAGSEIGIAGSGGPTCLTRPLWREVSR